MTDEQTSVYLPIQIVEPGQDRASWRSSPMKWRSCSHQARK